MGLPPVRAQQHSLPRPLAMIAVIGPPLGQCTDDMRINTFVDICSYGNRGELHVYSISPSIALPSNDRQNHIQIYQNAFMHTQRIVPCGTSSSIHAYTYARSNAI